MPQDNMKPNDRRNFPRFNRPKGDDDANPKKGPKFNIYWIWGIIAVVLIAVEYFGPFSPDAKQTNELEFRNSMLAKGDVEKIETGTAVGELDDSGDGERNRTATVHRWHWKFDHYDGGLSAGNGNDRGKRGGLAICVLVQHEWTGSSAALSN